MPPLFSLFAEHENSKCRKSNQSRSNALTGVKCDDERAGKLDVVMRGVKVLDELCDRLSRRMDAFEGSKKKIG